MSETRAAQGGNVPIVQTLYKDFGRGDMPAVLARLAPDVEWVQMSVIYAGTYQGGAAVVDAVFAPLAADWDGFTVTPHEFIDGGDQVVVLGEYRGTYKETGKSLQAPFAHVWTLAGGQVTRFRQYTDTHLGEQARVPG